MAQSLSPKTWDFFISRAGPDAPIADEIGRVLEAAGYSVILQQWDFGNRSFMSAMHAALESGARVIALLSPDYLKSDHCKAEWQSVIASDPTNSQGRLIVIRVVDCRPTGLLAPIAYVDLVQVRDDPVRLKEYVLAAVREGRQKETAAKAGVVWRAPVALLHSRIQQFPGFIGREDQLVAIEAALWPADRLETAEPVALIGMAGVGKSVLACQFGWRMRERYAGVWWLSGATRADIVEGLVSLGATMDPTLGEVQDRQEAARLALELIARLGSERRWLIIYDNVEGPEQIQGLMPSGGAHVVITTRWSDWYGTARGLAVEVFPLVVAAKFLLARAQREDSTGASLLANDLGCLPLALDHAGAYCRRTGISFETYRLMIAEQIKSAPKGVPYPTTVFATFNVAIAKASEAFAPAEFFLGLVSYFGPDQIPLDLLSEKVLRDLGRADAVAALSDVSLLTIGSFEDGTTALSLHRLVRQVVRSRLQASGQGSVAAALATALINQAFPSNDDPSDVRNWPTCSKLLSHALAALEEAPEVGESAPATSSLLNQVGLYLFARRELSSVETMYRRALKIDEAACGKDDTTVARDLNNLSQVLHATNRLAEAEPLKRHVLAIDEKIFGHHHPNVAADLNNLGQLLYDMNQLADAEPLMQRALDIFQATNTPNNPALSVLLYNLGSIRVRTNRPEQGEGMLERALAIDEEIFGSNHPNVARDLYGLAGVLIATHRWPEALSAMKKVSDIYRVCYGIEDPRTIAATTYIGVLADAADGKLQPRLPAPRAWAMDSSLPDAAMELTAAAQMLFFTTRFSEAEPLIRGAIASNEAIYGRRHPSVAIGLENLASLLADLHRFDEAEAVIWRVSEINSDSWGSDHYKVVQLLDRFADLFVRMGRPGQAEQLMRRVLDTAEAAVGGNHLAVGLRLNNLAELLRSMGRTKEAEPLYHRALAIVRSAPSATASMRDDIEKNLKRLRSDMERQAPLSSRDEAHTKGPDQTSQTSERIKPSQTISALTSTRSDRKRGFLFRLRNLWS